MRRRVQTGKVYTQGKAGPVSRLTLTVKTVYHMGEGATSRAKGDGIAVLRASGKVKGVDFLVQGRNHAAIRHLLVTGGEVDVDVRWTGSTAVTIVGAHGLDPQADNDA